MSVKNKVKRCNKEIKRLQEELEMYKDFKEIANTKIGDANPLKVLEVNKILDRQCKRQQFILDKIVDLIKNETINISGFKCIAIKDLQDIIKGEKK